MCGGASELLQGKIRLNVENPCFCRSGAHEWDFNGELVNCIESQMRLRVISVIQSLSKFMPTSKISQLIKYWSIKIVCINLFND